MKFGRILLGTAGALALSMSGGCFFVFDGGASTVEFDYVILAPDGAGNIIAPDCADTNINEVRLLVGDDIDLDGVLSDFEVED